MKSSLVVRLAKYFRLACIMAVLAVHLLLLAAQSLDAVPLWLAELTRFIPYYWVLLPSVVVVVLSIGLPLWVVLATLCNLALLLTVTMGMQWNWPQAPTGTGASVRVLTYNVKARSAKHREGGFTEIDREVRSHAPDIVALQDSNGWLSDVSETVPTPSRPLFGLPHVVALGQYVLASRYPLQSCSAGNIGVKDEPNAYLRCQVLIGGAVVQLVTVHFVSPRHSLVATRHGLDGGLQQWHYNLAQRMAQSAAVRKDLLALPRRVILMGDLNAVEQSPVVENLKSADLHDTFAQAGQGWGFTHGHALARHTDFLRIDHILVSADIAAVRSEVGGGQASEHNPVIADLVIGP